MRAIGRKKLNLEDLSGLNDLLNSVRPDIIVNAAAYTAVDKAESDQKLAFLINADVVKVLADYAALHNILLIHYSTDYVFDGEKEGPYLETDRVNPQNVYGMSKLEGEQAILQSGCNHLIFRTSWVFSATGKNFIKTILRLAEEKDNLSVVSDQYGAPTSARLIADVTESAISAYLSNKLNNGIYHLSASGVASWHQLACYVVEQALSLGAHLKLSSSKIYPISTEEYPVPAKRPKNSVLDTSLLFNTLAIKDHYWQIGVDKVLDNMVF